MNPQLQYRLDHLHRQTLEQQARQHHLAIQAQPNTNPGPDRSAEMRVLMVLVMALVVVLGRG